jgi:perosamine synthetase
MNMKYPLFKVNMPANVELKLKPILESGYISEGPVAKEFEKQLQDWIGNPYLSLVNSGTAALTIAMRLCNLQSGDEVITSPMTCLAMNEPILSVGAVPVFCDIDPTTGNIDSTKIEALITDKTKVILFVDWAGTAANLDEINRIAKKHNLKTIEDAAHALGATYKGRKVGTVSDFTCFSFQAIKHMTTIDGGALACSNQEDYDRSVLLRWFGCKRGHNTSPIRWEGDVLEYGYKMHMADVNAAIGLESMKTIDQIIAKHQSNAAYLHSLLPEQFESLNNELGSAFWIYTFKCRDSEHRSEVSNKLTQAEIGNSIVHTRNDAYSLFKDYPLRGDMSGTDEFCSRMLNIPCGWWLEKEDLDFIISVLRS